MLRCNKKKLPVMMSGDLLELPMFVTYMLSKISAYKLYRQTVTELSELSDRKLADLGISRFEIAAVARKASFA